MKDWFEGRTVDPVPLSSLPSWIVGVAIAIGIGLLAALTLGAAILIGGAW